MQRMVIDMEEAGQVRPCARIGPSFVLAHASTDFSPTVPPADATSKNRGARRA